MIDYIARLNNLASGSQNLHHREKCDRLLIEKTERSDTTDLQSSIVNIQFPDNLGFALHYKRLSGPCYDVRRGFEHIRTFTYYKNRELSKT